MGPAGQANDEAHTSDETNISGLRFPASWASHCGAGRTPDFFGPGWVHGEPEVGSPLSDWKPGEQEACTSQNHCVRSPEAGVLSSSWTLLVNPLAV